MLFNVENFLANPVECLKLCRDGKIGATVNINTYRQSIKDRLQTQYPSPKQLTLKRMWLTAKRKYISKLAPWVNDADIKNIVKNPNWAWIRDEIYARLVLDTRVKVLNQRISKIISVVNENVQNSVTDKQRKQLRVPGSGYYGPAVSEKLMNLVLRVWNDKRFIWHTGGVSFIQSIVVPELIFQFILRDLHEWGHPSCNNHATFLQENWNLPDPESDVGITDIEELEEETSSVICGPGKRRKVTSPLSSQKNASEASDHPDIHAVVVRSDEVQELESMGELEVQELESMGELEVQELESMGELAEHATMVDELESVVLNKAPKALVIAWENPSGKLLYQDRKDGPAIVCEKLIQNVTKEKYN
ncbi:hypothetical protein BGX38DRAFT_1271443 [Terfezia claveryi]|nr:hypothetical protein BGX38DRAFT_1271443 [Terfezia claveryi]